MHGANTVRLRSYGGHPGFECCHGTDNTQWIKPQDNTLRARKFIIKEKLIYYELPFHYLNYLNAVNPTHPNEVD